MGDDWDLDEVSEFLVVAATLLDLKAAKLLPQAEVEDEEDLALLEARDLLFARLLQYKAFKEAAAVIAALDAEFSRRLPARGHAGAALRRGAARPGARHRPGAAGPAGGQGDAPEAGAGGRRSTTSTWCGSASASTRRSCGRSWSGCARRRSGRCAPTARPPWRWWPGSWRCWSCTGRAWSGSTR